MRKSLRQAPIQAPTDCESIMSDPAIEAAQRAFDDMPLLRQSCEDQPILKALVFDVGQSAAREMAKPIRELYERWLSEEQRYALNSKNARSYETGVMYEQLRTLCRKMVNQLAPLIFSTEEIEDMK